MKNNNSSGSNAGRAMNLLLSQLILDVLIPYLIYKFSGRFGANTLMALTLGGLWSLVMVVMGLIRKRRIEGPAMFMLIAIVLSIGISLITNDPRIAIAKESIFTGGLGFTFLAYLTTRYSLMFYSCRSFVTQGDQESIARWNMLWERSQSFRHAIRSMDIVWGLSLIIEAIVRIVISYELPLNTSISVSPILVSATLILLMVWTGKQGKVLRDIEHAEITLM